MLCLSIVPQILFLVLNFLPLSGSLAWKTCSSLLYLRIYNHSYYLLPSPHFWVERIKLSPSLHEPLYSLWRNTEYPCVLFALGHLLLHQAPHSQIKNSVGPMRMRRKIKQDNQCPQLLTTFLHYLLCVGNRGR